VIDSNGGGHLSEMTTQKSEKKWTFERKKNNPKERIRTDAGPTLVSLSRADKEKEQNLIDLHINM
jgi:hypothetical protein